MQLHYFCITNIDIWTNIVINEEKKCMKPLKGRNNKIKELKLCRMMIFWRE